MACCDRSIVSLEEKREQILMYWKSTAFALETIIKCHSHVGGGDLRIAYERARTNLRSQCALEMKFLMDRFRASNTSKVMTAAHALKALAAQNND